MVKRLASIVEEAGVKNSALKQSFSGTICYDEEPASSREAGIRIGVVVEKRCLLHGI